MVNRDDAQCVHSNNRLHARAGAHMRARELIDTAPCDEVERLDPVSGSWELLPPMRSRRRLQPRTRSTLSRVPRSRRPTRPMWGSHADPPSRMAAGKTKTCSTPGLPFRATFRMTAFRAGGGRPALTDILSVATRS